MPSPTSGAAAITHPRSLSFGDRRYVPTFAVRDRGMVINGIPAALKTTVQQSRADHSGMGVGSTWPGSLATPRFFRTILNGSKGARGRPRSTNHRLSQGPPANQCALERKKGLVDVGPTLQALRQRARPRCEFHQTNGGPLSRASITEARRAIVPQSEQLMTRMRTMRLTWPARRS